MLNKEDGDDVSEEIKVYEGAKSKQLDSYKEGLENEALLMNKIDNKFNGLAVKCQAFWL